MTFALQLARPRDAATMHVRLLIEAMVREGRSEREIAAAVERARR
jgi:Xaa-Pro aminopeptidase